MVLPLTCAAMLAHGESNFTPRRMKQIHFTEKKEGETPSDFITFEKIPPLPPFLKVYEGQELLSFQRPSRKRDREKPQTQKETGGYPFRIARSDLRFRIEYFIEAVRSTKLRLRIGLNYSRVSHFIPTINELGLGLFWLGIVRFMQLHPGFRHALRQEHLGCSCFY